MDYRMISVNAKPNENIVDIISKKLQEQGYKHSKLRLNFVGFEAPAGTTFYLNQQKDVIKVPKCGNFISPFFGDSYMSVYSLSFPAGFIGDIYYIV